MHQSHTYPDLLPTPILFNLYDQNLIDECAAIKSTKGRLKWVCSRNTQKHLYAFISLIHYRLGADLPNHELFSEWLIKETDVSVSSEIISLIKCLQESRINQAKNLIKLEPKEFINQIKLRQEKQENGSSKLNWEPALNESKRGKYKLVAIKAQHGQGKTQGFIKNMLEHANTLNGGMVIAHRRKLLAQISKELNCCNYEDYDKRYYSGVSLTALKGMAICINSFKHEHFLSYLKQAHSVFIDEASQVLKSLYTNRQLDESVLNNLAESAKNSRCIYLTDADLTSKDISAPSQDTCNFDQFDFQNDTLSLVRPRFFDVLFKSKTYSLNGLICSELINYLKVSMFMV